LFFWVHGPLHLLDYLRAEKFHECYRWEMAEKEKLPAHSLIGKIVMVIVAIWLVIWMLRAYVL